MKQDLEGLRRTVEILGRQVEDVTRSVGRAIALVGRVDPTVQTATRRKLLELDRRLALLERGPVVVVPPGEPFSD